MVIQLEDLKRFLPQVASSTPVTRRLMDIAEIDLCLGTI